MLARGAGGIIHVASVAGYQAVPYQAVYAATKAFVLSLSEALAEEVRGTGVRVLALNPGPVETGFQAVAGAGIAPAQRSAVVSPAVAVAEGLAAYEAGRAAVVPGLRNRVNAVLVQLAPRRLVVRTVGRIMKGKPEVPPA